MDILLLLDRSYSMMMDFADRPCDPPSATCVPRWKTVVDALKTAIESSQARANWGLKLFPTPTAGPLTTFPGCQVSRYDPGNPNSSVEVAIAPNTAPAIRLKLDDPANAPDGYAATPTCQAIPVAMSYLLDMKSTNLARYILLATDGEPYCQSSAPPCTADVAITAITASVGRGIPVFVLGISIASGAATDNLNKMAVAGDKPRTDASDPTHRYYAANTPQSLTEKLREITSAIGSCTYQINEPPVPENVRVEIRTAATAGGTWSEVPASATAGWTYLKHEQTGAVDHTAIQFNGSTCEDIKDGKYVDMRVLFGCPDQPIPIIP